MKKSNSKNAQPGLSEDKEPEWLDMLHRLQLYQEAGCTLMLSGRKSYPGNIVKALFREDCIYMPDYIADENDVVRRIEFTRIRKD